MSHSLLDPGDLCTLQYVVTHVFCPLQLPDGDDHTIRNDYSLAGAVTSAMRLYGDCGDQANMAQWRIITQMLDNLHAVVQFERLDRFLTFSQLSSMNVGGMLSSLCSVLETHGVQMFLCSLFEPKMWRSCSERREISPFSSRSRYPQRPRM